MGGRKKKTGWIGQDPEGEQRRRQEAEQEADDGEGV